AGDGHRQSVAHLERPSLQVGLANLGNTCYQNAVLQALFHTDSLMEYILVDDISACFNKTNQDSYRGELVEAFYLLALEVFKRNPREVVTTDQFHKSVGKLNEVFENNMQHDAGEFPSFLMGGLSEDLNTVLYKPDLLVPESEPTNTEEKQSKVWREYYLRSNYFVIERLFMGQFQSINGCIGCGYSYTKFEKFTTLELRSPEDGSNTTLYECLHSYTKRELMAIVQLKRFSFDNTNTAQGSRTAKKLVNEVRIPLKNLDLAKYIRGKCDSALQPTYDLYSVIHHGEGVEEGHYWNTSFSREEEEWYFFSDGRVSKVTDDAEICSKTACILFYMKQDLRGMDGQKIPTTPQVAQNLARRGEPMVQESLGQSSAPQ
ncbi:hypothetical protein B484DRAFT_436185, partial [Ochromonadaceae sp. CCMP2298]